MIASLARFYRVLRTLTHIWTWRLPVGVELYIRVNWQLPWVVVMIHGGSGDYATSDSPWVALRRADVHRRLEDVTRALTRARARAGPDEDEDGGPPTPSPAIVMAAVRFETAMSRLREAGITGRCDGAQDGGPMAMSDMIPR